MAENPNQSTAMNIPTPSKPSDDERAAMLTDIGSNNGEDADEISASDAFKEFPPAP